MCLNPNALDPATAFSEMTAGGWFRKLGYGWPELIGSEKIAAG
jgi:hypothetical protein